MERESTSVLSLIDILYCIFPHSSLNTDGQIEAVTHEVSLALGLQ